MPTPNLPSGFDFTDPDVHAERLPVEELAELRRTAPIWWNEQPLDGVGGFDDGGFWVVSKHKDVKEISRRSDVFSSLEKTALPRYKDGTVGEQVERASSCCSTWTRRSTPICARSSPAASRPGPSSGSATTSASGPGRSWKARRRKDPATSSNRCRASFRCKPSPACWVCRRKTG